MKNIILFIFIVISVFFTSCGNSFKNVEADSIVESTRVTRVTRVTRITLDSLEEVIIYVQEKGFLYGEIANPYYWGEDENGQEVEVESNLEKNFRDFFSRKKGTYVASNIVGAKDLPSSYQIFSYEKIYNNEEYPMDVSNLRFFIHE